MNIKNENDEIESLTLYMKEAGESPLLSLEEERELVGQMQAWSLNKNNCSKKIEKAGRAARESLIKSNLRLVVKIAKQFRNIGLEYADLINEGNIGLMSAIDKYDLEKGAKLSYYSSFWIKQSIRRSISNKGRTIRLPVGVVEGKLKIHRYVDQFEQNESREPSEKEIAKGTDMPLKKVRKLMKLCLQSESLNAIVTENDDELGSLMENESSENPFLAFCDKNECEILNQFLDKLDERRRYIVIRRFGLDGSKPQTLEVIGKKFNLTRERVRQLQLSALNTLREMYKKINKNKVND
jgi:RNA polymerase primary sigma factor